MPHKLMIVKDGGDQGRPYFNIVDYYTATSVTDTNIDVLNNRVVSTIIAAMWNDGDAPAYGGYEHNDAGGRFYTSAAGCSASRILNEDDSTAMMSRTIVSDNSPPPQLPPQMMSMAIKLAKVIKVDSLDDPARLGESVFKLCIVPADGYGNVVYYVEHGAYKGMQYLQNAGCSMMTAQGQSRAGCMCECQGFYKVNTRARHFKRYCNSPSAVAARNAAPMNAAPLPAAPVPPRVIVRAWEHAFPPMVCNILLSSARDTNCPVMLSPLEAGTPCALLPCGHILSRDAYDGINAGGRTKMCPICRDRDGWRHVQLADMPAADLPPPPPADDTETPMNVAPLPPAPVPPTIEQV